LNQLSAAELELGADAVQTVVEEKMVNFLGIDRKISYYQLAKRGFKPQQIATEDDLKKGLICAFYTLETYSTFTVRGNRQTQKLEVIRHRARKRRRDLASIRK